MSLKPYYDEDGITIFHADCRELVGSLHVEALVTDPPYGIASSQDLNWGSGKRGKLPWDTTIDDLTGILAAAQDRIVWGGNYYALPPSRGWLIWYKRDSLPSMSDVELAWTSMDMNSRLFDHTISAMNSERGDHPTPKPLALMKWCLSFVREGTVLDPFMGSGTTLRAAKDLGRRAIGVEISERYCEIAANRLRQRVLPLEMA